jgi:hypothetical protein
VWDIRAARVLLDLGPVWTTETKQRDADCEHIEP